MTDAPEQTPDDADPTSADPTTGADEPTTGAGPAERPSAPRRRQQTMKPMKAAKKLGIHLPATPPEFRDATEVTRSELARLMTDPPAWLEELRRTGPHPREVVAARLDVSIAGLVRGGAGDALTTEQVDELRADPPPWLVRERANLARVRAEEERLARQADEVKKPRHQPKAERPAR